MSNSKSASSENLDKKEHASLDDIVTGTQVLLETVLRINKDEGGSKS